MKRKRIATLALILFVAGIAVIFGYYFGMNFLQADSATLVASEQDTLRSFLTFGIAMVVSSVILFAILSGF